MVFVLKKEEGGGTYYYLAHNQRVSRKKWKSFRKYIGKKLPPQKKLEKLKKEFVEEFKIRLEKEFEYLDKEKLAKVDYIIGEFQERIRKYPRIALEKIERDFTIKFTYNTNAIEGNKITLIETAALLNKKIAPEGKSLREIHEITNTEKALNYVKSFKGGLSKRLVCELHKIIMKNIDDETAGKLRTFDVAIQGANWLPPRGKEVKAKFEDFMQWFKENKTKLHPIELAAITHLKFIEVHPFGDGNGRIARLITNFLLVKNGYPPINIKEKNTIEYVKVLQYAQNTQKFKELCDWFLQKLGEDYAEILTKNKET
ncbi:MAG: Fic family protein [Candidatus Diapherotrites archaeon]|nr:Fic family protein [Candidatus Diapherotrites archaeon]